jgi:hypothetical protein
MYRSCTHAALNVTRTVASSSKWLVQLSGGHRTGHCSINYTSKIWFTGSKTLNPLPQKLSNCGPKYSKYEGLKCLKTRPVSQSCRQCFRVEVYVNMSRVLPVTHWTDLFAVWTDTHLKQNKKHVIQEIVFSLSLTLHYTYLFWWGHIPISTNT